MKSQRQCCSDDARAGYSCAYCLEEKRSCTPRVYASTCLSCEQRVSACMCVNRGRTHPHGAEWPACRTALLGCLGLRQTSGPSAERPPVNTANAGRLRSRSARPRGDRHSIPFLTVHGHMSMCCQGSRWYTHAGACVHGHWSIVNVGRSAGGRCQRLIDRWVAARSLGG